mmetsp:Transcript_736/g.1076  ORF Transcript_736/g.1076 Transcript_736/m.1076 type:complete len:336 (+) Transcript_736:224-1231(+)
MATSPAKREKALHECKTVPGSEDVKKLRVQRVYSEGAAPAFGLPFPLAPPPRGPRLLRLMPPLRGPALISTTSSAAPSVGRLIPFSTAEAAAPGVSSSTCANLRVLRISTSVTSPKPLKWSRMDASLGSTEPKLETCKAVVSSSDLSEDFQGLTVRVEPSSSIGEALTLSKTLLTTSTDPNSTRARVSRVPMRTPSTVPKDSNAFLISSSVRSSLKLETYTFLGFGRSFLARSPLAFSCWSLPSPSTCLLVSFFSGCLDFFHSTTSSVSPNLSGPDSLAAMAFSAAAFSTKVKNTWVTPSFLCLCFFKSRDLTSPNCAKNSLSAGFSTSPESPPT